MAIDEVPQFSLSVEGTARALGISKRQVYYLMGAGDLPSFNVGKRRLIPVAEIERLIAKLLLEAAG